MRLFDTLDKITGYWEVLQGEASYFSCLDCGYVIHGAVCIA